MKTDRHLIFGTGLIGSYLAACFTQSGLDIQLIGRDSSRRAFEHGFQISDYLGNHFKSPKSPRFTNSNAEAFDVVWLTVKCTSISGICNELREFIHPDTTIICCQNGFGSDEIIKQAFPDNPVLCCVIGFNVVTLNQHHWHRSTDGSLVIEQHAKSNLFTSLHSRLLPLRLSENMHEERWAKLQLNLANSINAIADIPIKQMLKDRGYRQVIAAMMDELLLVTNALGLQLPKVSAVNGATIPKVLRLPNFAFKLIAQRMLAVAPDARTSMWHDINNQRQTEIDFINGAITSRAKQLNINTPVNDIVIDLVKSIERGETESGITSQQLKRKLSLWLTLKQTNKQR